MQRIGSAPSNNRLKLVPMFVAPFLSRLSGSMQSRCVQRRSPRIFFFISVSFSFHGPHAPRQRQHVFDVYASGVGATTKRVANFRINPTPMHGGLPRLQAPVCPATINHTPRAVRKHKLTDIIFLLDTFNSFVQSFF